MGKLIAKVRIVVGVALAAGGIERREFAPGAAVSGLNDHDKAELVNSGALIDSDAEDEAAEAQAKAAAAAAAEFDAARHAVQVARDSTQAAPAEGQAVQAPSGTTQPAPSEGLTVAQLKDALAAKGIAIPEGTTLKADLAALLDGAPAA